MWLLAALRGGGICWDPLTTTGFVLTTGRTWHQCVVYWEYVLTMMNYRLDVFNTTTRSESTDVWDSEPLTKGLDHHSNISADVFLLFMELAGGNVDVGGDFIRRKFWECWCARASNEN